MRERLKVNIWQMELNVFSYHTLYVLKSHRVSAAGLLLSTHVSITAYKTFFLLLYQHLFWCNSDNCSEIICLPGTAILYHMYVKILTYGTGHYFPSHFLLQNPFPPCNAHLLQLQHQLLPLNKAKILMSHISHLRRFCHLICTIRTKIGLQKCMRTQEQAFIEKTLSIFAPEYQIKFLCTLKLL